MRKLAQLVFAVLLLQACTKFDQPNLQAAAGGIKGQESVTFKAVSTIPVGGTGAAEISAYDEQTRKLFIVNNTSGNNRIDVYDLADPSKPKFLTSLTTAPYGGGFVNSVDVSGGKLAAAIEAAVKTNNGEVVVLRTDNYAKLAEVTVGALPDMVTFSPDGKLILIANEGEPNDAYTIDPEGSVSIIDVENNYAVTTLGFASFASQADALKAKGFRIFGKNASFTQDIEPEYIAVSANSKKAWVTLQENNGIARIDLVSKTIEEIMPMGYKDYSLAENAFDLSDRPANVLRFQPWNNVFGIYEPDGIAVMTDNNIPFVITANEGDAREYTGFTEVVRVNTAGVTLDPLAFPAPAFWSLAKNYWKEDTILGRLNIHTTIGKTDGKYQQLYSLGGRSFSIWHGQTGELIFDSKNELDRRCVELGIYVDTRSDDKGSEPETVTVGRVGNNNLLFVALERANAVFVYDVANPRKPSFLQYLPVGVAPEGVCFVPREKSPNGKSMLIVSNETGGTVNVFTTE